MGFQFSDRSQELQLRITKFLDDHIYPAEEVYAQQMQEFTEQGDRWQIPQIIEDKKEIVTNNSIESLKKTSDQLDQAYENLDDTSKEIINILEQYIRPAVASDGGNIIFKSYNPKTKIVKVILQGACSGCPSSTFTLKNGIENMLKEMMGPKIESVEAFNG